MNGSRLAAGAASDRAHGSPDRVDDPDASITATQSINRFSDEPTEANRRPLVLALCTERVLWDTLGVGVSSYSSYGPVPELPGTVLELGGGTVGPMRS